MSASKATTGGGTFKLISGQLFSYGNNSDVAIVGQSLAQKNNLSVGSTFTAYSTTVKVVGIYSTGSSFGDGQIIFPLNTLQQLTGEINDLTSVTVYVSNINDLTSVTNQIKNLLGSSADVTNSIIQAQNTTTTLTGIQSISLYSLIGTTIASIVIILMLMIIIVRERIREIGILKAIGAKDSTIAKQFLVEAITITLISSIIGIIIGFVAGNPITKLLVSSNATTSTNAIGGGFGRFAAKRFAAGGGLKAEFSNIHAVINFSVVIYGIVFALLIAAIASVGVSLIIARIRPSQVLRSE